MARRTTKKKDLTPEEKLAQALVPVEEQPYEVPGNWCWVRLHHLLEPSKRKTEDFSDLSIKYVGLEHMEKDGGIVSFGFTNELKSTKNIFTTGQLLYGKLRPYLNKHGIAQFDGVCSTDILVFSARKSTTAPFVNYFFDQQFFLDYVISNSKGINLPRVSETVVLKAICPLPPLPEQLRIVARIESLFAKLDEAKEKTQAVVDGFEARKAAILHKAFTGELTKKWREERGIDLDSWKTQKLSDTSITIIDGDRGNNYPKKNDFSSHGYCIFLSAKNVTKSGFRFDDLECITKEKDEQLRNGRLERGDMVLTTRGTIGNTAIYDNTVPYEHLRINSGMVIYRGGDEFIKQFLVWLYQSKLITNQIERLRTGTAQPQLPIKVMKMLLLPIPMLEEQTEIVRILDSLLDKQQQARDAAVEVLDQIDTMKKAILARAFRGELGTNDPQEESAVELVRRALDE